ncbi:MAG: tRNA (N6-threonylcarbamoyladenosine(37)-N6)-methyltransferase TrmO [Coriobacteriaceae bacterium]|nr:tRNA (N6-threonylcarbamoyladenosine(37)-N6)-methyltransferase TrmO [Coriobacteriaceae bacterium]
MELRPIAHIRTDLPQKFGIPRNSFLAPHLQGRIVFEPEFALPQAVAGLEEFSHLWLLWEFENGVPGGTVADVAADSAGSGRARPGADASSGVGSSTAAGAGAGAEAAVGAAVDVSVGEPALTDKALLAKGVVVPALGAANILAAVSTPDAGVALNAAGTSEETATGRAATLVGEVVTVSSPAGATAPATIPDAAALELSNRSQPKWSPTVRPPRLGGSERKGVFATRSPFRPNPIGLTCVKLDRVELTADGPVIHVLAADLRDGTPIYDIKPYIPFADCHPEASGGWIEAAPWQELEVEMGDDLRARVPAGKSDGLVEVLRQDPRRAGSKHEPDRVYHLAYAGLDIAFSVDGLILRVLDVA